MADRDLPDLPSDEELGIDLKELAKLLDDKPSSSPPSSRPPGSGGGGPEARPPGSWGAALLTLALLLAGAWMGSEKRALPAPVPANVPDTVFSSGRAMARLVEIARAPRPVGSPEHARVRGFIVDRLEALGLDPEIQTSLTIRRRGQEVRAVTVRNILARIPGTASTGTVVLTSHYDAVPLSGGAGDAGTGVVAILEAVRALQAGDPLQNDVLVLITDGEELGLLGARAFVEEHPWMDDVSVVLSVEMRGGGGPSHMFETGAENGWIVRAMQASDPRPFATSFSVELYRRLPNDTDFTPFRQAGVQGLNFAGIDRAWVYHQPTDVPMNIQEETLQHHGVRILAIARHLGGRDLTLVRAPDLVYTTVPVVGIVAYPLGWALPISVGILLLWFIAAGICIARGSSWAGFLAGVGVVLTGGLVAWGLGWGLVRLLPGFHPELGSMTPLVYGEGWYVLGLVAVTLAVTLGLLGMARTRFSIASLGAGAVLAPVVGAVVLAVVAPLTAFELQVAALTGVLAVGVAATTGGSDVWGRPGTWVRVALLLLALPALLVLVPLFQGLWIAMSLRMAPALGVLVVVIVACTLPAMGGLGEPNRWWAPVTGVILGFVAVVGGILQAGPSAERPVHSTLLFALDREGDEAVWATREDPGFRWAENQVGPFTGERDLSRLLVSGTYRTTWAPTPDAPAPIITVLGPAPGAPPGTARLRVDSSVGAEIVSVILREDEGALVALQGRSLPPGDEGAVGARRPVTRVTHQGVPDGELTVDVEVMLGVEVLHLAVVEEHLRPWILVGPEPFQRPSHLMPNPRTRSDRALIRTPVRLDLGAVSDVETGPGGDGAP
jgi:hypothetical protein